MWAPAKEGVPMTAFVQDPRPGSADDNVLLTIHISINNLAHSPFQQSSGIVSGKGCLRVSP